MIRGNKIIKLMREIYSIEDNYFYMSRPLNNPGRISVRDRTNNKLWKEDYSTEDFDDYHIPHCVKSEFYKRRGDND